MALFEPETARKIERFGAALSGDLARLDARDLSERDEKRRQKILEDQQQTQLSNERIQAAAIDNRVFATHLRNGNFDQARTLLVNRVGDLGGIEGADDSDSLEMLQLIDDGRIEDALIESDAFDQAAVLNEIIPADESRQGATFQQGTGAAAGTAFNPATGEFSGTPLSQRAGVSGGRRAPANLLKNLEPHVRAAAKEAFELAGGGKEGVKALNEQVKLSKEATRFEDVPNILNSSFPQASTAERAQLDAIMSAASNVDDGLKQAGTLRTEQRRLKKAKSFQERAVSLLDRVIANDQIGDVTGSIEGAVDFRLSDVESELIADINEAQNILTAENMDLMTGVLSESDIKLLKNLSSGGLNRKRSEARFISDVTQMRDKLASKLVETADDSAPQAPQSGTVGRFQVEVVD